MAYRRWGWMLPSDPGAAQMLRVVLVRIVAVAILT
jgi:hypothetical protein